MHKTLWFYLRDFIYDFNFINILTSAINLKLEFKFFLEYFQFRIINLNVQAGFKSSNSVYLNWKILFEIK